MWNVNTSHVLFKCIPFPFRSIPWNIPHRKDPSNYQPISLKCNCSKMLEHIIHSCISDHLEYYQVLCDQQRMVSDSIEAAKLSWLLLYMTLHRVWTMRCFTACHDFCKAFDKVPHLCLLQKLHHYGIQGTLLSWIEAFLTNRVQHVTLDNKQSIPTNVLSGVRTSKHSSGAFTFFTVY